MKQTNNSQFSVRSLLLVLTLSGVVLGVALRSGTVLGSYLCLLALMYFSSLFFAQRLRIIIAILAAIFAGLPWLGIGTGAFIYPGMGRPLPLIPLRALGPIGELISIPLRLLYHVAEVPLHFLSICHDDIADFVFFDGGGVTIVRPFVVFAFWSGIASVIAVTSVAAEIRRTRGAG